MIFKIHFQWPVRLHVRFLVLSVKTSGLSLITANCEAAEFPSEMKSLWASPENKHKLVRIRTGLRCFPQFQQVGRQDKLDLVSDLLLSLLQGLL